MTKYLSFVIILLITFCTSSGQKNERIAILDFQVLGNDHDFNQYKWMALGFSETLTDVFSRIPQFSVIERIQLNKVLSEQDFQKAISVDTNSVVRIGKILGVQKVLLGSCQIATGHMMINMRIVNVETGEISPLEKLPIIGPIDSVFYLQKKICYEILEQYKIFTQSEIRNDIEIVTTRSTRSIKAYEFLNKGILLYNNGQYTDALQMYSYALKHDIKYSKAYYKRGLTNYALKQYEDAANDFNTVVDYIPKDSIYQLMSNAYYMKGDFEKSHEYLMKAQKLNPSRASITRQLSELYKTYRAPNLKKSNNPKIEMFETVYEYQNGIAKVKKNGKYGFIDTEYNVVIPIKFDNLGEFSHGLAAAQKGKKWGFIDIEGEYQIAPTFTEVEKFNSKGLAAVMIKYKWGVIDTAGKQIIPIEFDRYYVSGWNFQELVRVCKTKGLLGMGQVCGAYDKTGNNVIPLVYDDIELTYDNESFIKVSLNGKWGMVDKKNNLIVPFKYDDKDCIRPFRNGYAAIKVNERWGFVNLKGIEVIAPEYDRVNDFALSYFEVKYLGKWGIIDSNRVYKIPLLYDNLEKISDQYFAAKRGSFWGIININNKIICDFFYNSMGSEASTGTLRGFTEGEIGVPVIKNEKLFWINEKCKCIFRCD